MKDKYAFIQIILSFFIGICIYIVFDFVFFNKKNDMFRSTELYENIFIEEAKNYEIAIDWGRKEFIWQLNILLKNFEAHTRTYEVERSFENFRMYVYHLNAQYRDLIVPEPKIRRKY